MDHLIHSQVIYDDNDNADDVVTEPTCNKIDMSNIDFGNKKKATSSKLQEQKEFVNSPKASSMLASTTVDNLSVTSEMESQLLNDTVQQPTSILYEGCADSELIDGMWDENYVAILNQIDVINEMLQDHNNGDT